jgi:NADH-quinone oxidoreductase subunit G
MEQLLAAVKLIVVSSSQTECVAKAAVAVPVASYSEDSGSIINCDGRLQRYEMAVVKNQPIRDLISIVQLLGGEVKNVQEARAGLQAAVAVLKDIDLEQIPAEGIALTESEVAHVAA